MNGTVSIVVCVLNGKDYIDGILRYVKEQTYPGYELLFVVSSKSTDGSKDIIRNITDGKRIRCVYQKEDTGLGGAKNLGIEASKGDYIWFLDVDDSPSLDFLSRMMSTIEKKDCDLVISNFSYVGKRSSPSHIDGEVIKLTGTQALHARTLNLIPVSSWSMLYSKQQIIDNDIRFTEGMSEDIGFTYNMLNISDTVCFITEPLYGYYLNPSSLCSTNKDKRGQTEIDSYSLLSETLDVDTYTKRRFCILSIRSAGHMTFIGFRRAQRSEAIKKMVRTSQSRYVSFEHFCARYLSPLYFAAIRAFFAVYYYRSGKAYADKNKLRTLRRISKGN